jgi:CBS domain containing-hemolysin-like protein
MVMVVDEFGGTSGLVALQDLIAEIIGDTLEGQDSETIALQMIDEQTYLVQAQMNLEEVNELLELDLPLADEYQTLGGFLLYQWQKIPTQGETLQYDQIEFTVVSAQGPRLSQIRIHRLEPSSIDPLANNAAETEKPSSLNNDVLNKTSQSPEPIDR